MSRANKLWGAIIRNNLQEYVSCKLGHKVDHSSITQAGVHKSKGPLKLVVFRGII